MISHCTCVLFQCNLGGNASDKGNDICFDLVPQAGETSSPGGISRDMACTRALENRTRARTLDSATQIIKHHIVYSLDLLTMPFFFLKLPLMMILGCHFQKKGKKMCLLLSLKLEFIDIFFFFVSSQLLAVGHLVKTTVGDSLLIELCLFCSILPHVCVHRS